MRYLFASVTCFALAACNVPAPTTDISVSQSLDGELGSKTTVAIDVETATETQGPSWALSTEEAAEKLEDRLRFRLLDSGLIYQVVAPDAEATHDMKVVITHFQHEAPSSEEPNGQEELDGFNEMTTEVRVFDRTDQQELITYRVDAKSGSETKYGNNAPSLIGPDPMLDAAAKGITNGLREAAADNDTQALLTQ